MREGKGKITYKLIVTDLDGTLLNSKMQVSVENEAAIAEISKKGCEFSVSSGRTFHEILPEIIENPNIRYVAYSNGAGIYDTREKREIWSAKLNNKEINLFFDVLKGYDVLPIPHFNGKAHIEASKATEEVCDHYHISEYYRNILREMVICDDVEAISRASDCVESVFMIFAKESERLEVAKRLTELGCFSVSSSTEGCIEAYSSKAGKGNAAWKLSEILGVERNAVIAVGDHLNDVSMFKKAGLALCTSNGNDDAKLAADAVICSNDEHIARFILRNYF